MEFIILITIWIIVKTAEKLAKQKDNMSERLKYLSKDKEMRIQQLSLLIHNCRVFGTSEIIRQEYVDELNKLNKRV